MSDYSVELSNVTKTYPAASASRRGGSLRPDVQALRGIDLAIAPGEFFTLLGPSGCGKTTTLRIIAGSNRPAAAKSRFKASP